MKRLMNILMLSCKKASGLIEKKIHFSLGPVEKIQLFIHTGMCDACKSYQKQSKDMDSILNDHIQSNDTISEPLSDDFKRQIINKLEENN